MSKIKLIFRIIRIVFYVSLILTFIIIPCSYFENANTICFIKRTIGIDCPTCGVTRAFSNIMHLNFKKAYEFNSIFTIAICPICLCLFIIDSVTIIKDFIKKENTETVFEYFLTI